MPQDQLLYFILELIPSLIFCQPLISNDLNLPRAIVNRLKLSINLYIYSELGKLYGKNNLPRK